KLREIDRRGVELEELRLDLRHEEKILHDALQAHRATAGGAEVGASRQPEAVLFVAEQLEEAGDRRERRAQLVRDSGEERVAEPLEAAVGRHLLQGPDP